MTEPIRLAVYGSLKSTQMNHAILGEDAKVIARGIRVPGFSMYNICKGWYPGAVIDPEGPGIDVEIVEIPPHMLRVVDAYEGGMFVRTKVTMPNGEPALMYLYDLPFTPTGQGGSFYELIPSGRWEDVCES